MPELKKLKELVAEVCKNVSCDYVLLYGSYAKGLAKPYSDIDLAIAFKSGEDAFIKAAEVAFELEEMLNIRVSAVPINAIDDYVLKYEVYSEGLLLYCENFKRYLDDKVNAIDLFLDFQHHFEKFYRRAMEELKSW